MKSCKTCNEFMCGQSNTDCISEYCGGKNTYIPKMQNTKLDYCELRDKIHNILEDFLQHEIEMHNAGEFDFEYMECCTDDILHLIKGQGGSY